MVGFVYCLFKVINLLSSCSIINFIKDKALAGVTSDFHSIVSDPIHSLLLKLQNLIKACMIKLPDDDPLLK